MLYSVQGDTQSKTTGGETFNMPVKFLVKLADTQVTGEYVIIGGVPIENVELTPYNERCAEQETYNSFANHVADKQRAINEHVVIKGTSDLDASICQLFADQCVILLAKMRVVLNDRRTVESERSMNVEDLYIELRNTVKACKMLVK